MLAQKGYAVTGNSAEVGDGAGHIGEPVDATHEVAVGDLASSCEEVPDIHDRVGAEGDASRIDEEELPVRTQISVDCRGVSTHDSIEYRRVGIRLNELHVPAVVDVESGVFNDRPVPGMEDPLVG